MVDSEERLAERVSSESAMSRQFEQRTVARCPVHSSQSCCCTPHEGASRSFFLLILVIDPFKARGSAQSTGERGLGY